MLTKVPLFPKEVALAQMYGVMNIILSRDGLFESCPKVKIPTLFFFPLTNLPASC